MKKSIVQAGMLLALASGGLFPMLAQAQATMDHSKMDMAKMPSMTDGEVRKVDKEQGKVTLKHGPIANLDMPGMTMVFKVTNPKLLESIKSGDKVKFAAENLNGALTVTAIEVAK